LSYTKSIDDCIIALKNEGKSSRAIATLLGISKSGVNERYNRIVGSKQKELQDNSRILLISDMHIPYHHKDSFEFLSYLKDKYEPTRVISLGDLEDNHSLSYHDSDPDLYSAGHELALARKHIKQLERMFPVMDILESNHGSLAYRKAKTHGFPKHYIKSYNDVLGVGEGWKWHDDLTITLSNGQQCYFHHAKTSDVLKLSQTMGMNAVQGHNHNSFDVRYWANPNGLFWGLQIGCLVDNKSLAFAYNKLNLKKPIIGIAVIINGIPTLEPMLLGKQGRWIKPG